MLQAFQLLKIVEHFQKQQCLYRWKGHSDRDILTCKVQTVLYYPVRGWCPPALATNDDFEIYLIIERLSTSRHITWCGILKGSSQTLERSRAIQTILANLRYVVLVATSVFCWPN